VRKSKSLSLVAAGIASLGYLIMVYPPLAVSQSASMAISEFMDVYPVFKLAGFAAVPGTVLFGIAVLRQKYYAAWTGIVLVVCPPIMAAVLLREGPMIVANVVNVVQSVAWIVMSLRALRQQHAAA
jgi:hypothetical protein